MVKSKGFGLQVERMEELISVGMILFGTCFFFRCIHDVHESYVTRFNSIFNLPLTSTRQDTRRKNLK